MRNNSNHLLMVFLLFVTTVLGQQMKEDVPIASSLEKYQLTTNVLAPGLSFEGRFVGNTSISLGYTPGFSSFGAANGFGYALQSRLRWYTNMKSRKGKNKNVSGNSGDYIAVGNSIFAGSAQITGNFETLEDVTINFNGALDGIQRKSYNNRFRWNAEVGFGSYSGNGIDNGAGFLLNINFGFILIKKP